MVAAYLIVEISEREGELFALWDASNAKIEPSFVVINILNVRFTVLSHPEVKLIFVCAAIGS